ncbi:MAG TPA: hypothetical protein VNN18_12530 [Candidatus Xenobia bacterium]|nr:hypothetical protein [Candidatus Xenobia bacterium]
MPSDQPCGFCGFRGFCGFAVVPEPPKKYNLKKNNRKNSRNRENRRHREADPAMEEDGSPECQPERESHERQNRNQKFENRENNAPTRVTD